VPKAGDTFAFRLTCTEWLSGRVLLDVREQCIKPRQVTPDSRLAFFNATFLVEIYATPTARPEVDAGRILVPSLFVNTGGFRGTWEVLGNVAVDPTQVDFPPVLAMRGVKPHLNWGELLITLTSTEGADELRIFGTVHGSGLIPATCMVALGRGAELDPMDYKNPSALGLGSSDLRFSPHEERVFAAAGLGKRGTYYDEALAHGFDLARFYA
jgi:hypothetical protein